MNLKFLVTCDRCWVDETGKLSISGIFDEINAKNFPTGLAEMATCAVILGKPNVQYTVTMKMKKEEDGAEIIKPVFLKGKFSEKGQSNLLVRMPNMMFKTEGKYIISLCDASNSLELEFGNTTIQLKFKPIVVDK